MDVENRQPTAPEDKERRSQEEPDLTRRQFLREGVTNVTGMALSSLNSRMAKAGADTERSKTQETQTKRNRAKGIRDVLQQNGVPVKVIASDRTPIRMVAKDISAEERKKLASLGIEPEHRPNLLEPGKHYFVFQETEKEYLIGDVQDSEQTLGWVPRSKVREWVGRTVLTDGKGRVQGYILSEDREVSKVVSAKTGRIETMDAGQLVGKKALYYSRTEVIKALTDLTSLSAILDSGKMPVSDIPRVFGSFLTQNQADFLDLKEVGKTMELFPKNSLPDLVQRGHIYNQLKKVSAEIRANSEYLEKIGLMENDSRIYSERLDAFLLPITVNKQE